MKITQKEIIKRFLREEQNWVESFKLRGKSTPYGFVMMGDEKVILYK